MTIEPNISEPITADQRRADFIAAVTLLGGQRAVAPILNISERTMRALVSGSRHIHDGFMGDITAALVAHAADCRALAKRTDPLFTANRLPPPPRGGAAHKRMTAHG